MNKWVCPKLGRPPIPLTTVKRGIDVLAAQLELDVSKFGGIYLDSMNRISEYDFVGNQDFVSFLVATKKLTVVAQAENTTSRLIWRKTP